MNYYYWPSTKIRNKKNFKKQQNKNGNKNGQVTKNFAPTRSRKVSTQTLAAEYAEILRSNDQNLIFLMPSSRMRLQNLTF